MRPLIFLMNKKQHKITFRNRENFTFHVSQDQSILDISEENGYILPVACRYGGCITCAAKLISGKVKQPNGTAINKRQSQEGYVLLCVARPQEDCILDVGVESHNKLYINPFSISNAQDLIDKGKS
ncbi:MAG: 2Fe-2S iron-sulfur cluster-binding protein [Paracoccaceae bacterium]